MAVTPVVESVLIVEDGAHAAHVVADAQPQKPAHAAEMRRRRARARAPGLLDAPGRLRALALGAVLMFHFGRDGFGAGGFIGVDMFFLLSGFLVTRNILDDAVRGSFSLRAFYRKRFWRLYPSSLCTCVCVLVAALSLYSGELLEQALRSVVASMVSVSNMLFYSEAGYWDSGAELKPLLHTWSLSVEEQFYLLWPALLLLLARTNDPSGAFFLLPSRVYQFSAGAALLGLSEHLQEHQGIVVDAASVVGLTTCVASFFLLGQERAGLDGGWSGLLGRLPSGIKAMPTLFGTMLLILLPQSIVSRHVLGNSAMTSIGRVSYTLYLVHWPIRVFLGFVANTMPFAQGWFDHWALMVVLTAVVGIVQYTLVEKRLRIRDSVPFEYWISIGLVMVSALGTALYVLYGNGAPTIPGLTESAAGNSIPLSQDPAPAGSNSLLYESIVEPELKDGHKVYVPRALANASRLVVEQWPKGQITATFPPARWINASVLSQDRADWNALFEHIERASPVPLKRKLSIEDAVDIAKQWNLIRMYGLHDFWWCEKRGGKASEVALGGMYPCVLGDASKEPSALIIGDSEVGSLKPVLSFVGKELGASIWSINNVACWLEFVHRWTEIAPEKYDASAPLHKQACALAGLAARKAIDALPPGSVVFLHYEAISWPKYMADNPKAVVIKPEVEYIKSRGLRAVFIGILPAKRMGKCLPTLKPPAHDCLEFSGKEAYNSYKNVRTYVEDTLQLPYKDFADAFRVSPGSNQDYFVWSVDGMSLMRDDRHVNLAGSLYAANFIADLYREYEIGRHPIRHQ
ncbi:O-acetyltransferase OatA [Porphyridium purpureum]|uniref:O-acetyltransferase OatA n=1 Tax=Porphyridium purpureum TaxID=35688 RepID=A0A5J4YJ69_PORPP|nr:O-acetyltransferase OatA [Porphyridium purpureum]|eukprot:POR5247..scf270_19